MAIASHGKFEPASPQLFHKMIDRRIERVYPISFTSALVIAFLLLCKSRISEDIKCSIVNCVDLYLVSPSNTEHDWGIQAVRRKNLMRMDDRGSQGDMESFV